MHSLSVHHCPLRVIAVDPLCSLPCAMDVQATSLPRPSAALREGQSGMRRAGEQVERRGGDSKDTIQGCKRNTQER